MCINVAIQYPQKYQNTDDKQKNNRLVYLLILLQITFTHVDIIWNECNIILQLKTRMSYVS